MIFAKQPSEKYVFIFGCTKRGRERESERRKEQKTSAWTAQIKYVRSLSTVWLKSHWVIEPNFYRTKKNKIRSIKCGKLSAIIVQLPLKSSRSKMKREKKIIVYILILWRNRSSENFAVSFTQNAAHVFNRKAFDSWFVLFSLENGFVEMECRSISSCLKSISNWDLSAYQKFMNTKKNYQKINSIDPHFIRCI